MPAPFPPAAWRDRFSVSGWALLPLRLFLGFTMLYAGLLKLSDPNYLNASSSASVQSQMLNAIKHSPISFVVSHTYEHATLFGLAIAIGEVAVGLSLLLGLWVRLGALGGFLLSLSFLLTVSWGITPYFFGPDIVFMFAFIPLMLAGDGGVWSLGASIRAAVMRDAGLDGPKAAKATSQEVALADRRAVIRTAGVAAGAGIVALGVGFVARLLGGDASSTTASGGGTATPSPSSSPSASGTPTASPSASPSPTKTTATPTPPPNGTKVASASQVKVGSAFAYDAPDGNPAFIVQPAAGTYLSYSRVCTHEGCTVDFTGSEFACPCHGAQFAEDTGDVIAGPARAPLQKYTVVESGGNLYVV